MLVKLKKQKNKKKFGSKFCICALTSNRGHLVKELRKRYHFARWSPIAFLQLIAT